MTHEIVKICSTCATWREGKDRGKPSGIGTCYAPTVGTFAFCNCCNDEDAAYFCPPAAFGCLHWTAKGIAS